jgi:hypothetical protein
MQGAMDKFKEFWPLLKDWYEDNPSTIIDWMDEFYEDPDEALEALKEMNNAYERDMEEMSADNAKV